MINKTADKKIILTILVLSTLIKIFHISVRVPHHDELSNLKLIYDIGIKGFYHYQADHHHGPLFFYIIKLVDLLFDDGIRGMRITNVIISQVTLLYIIKICKLIKTNYILPSIIFTTSPAFYFFSRYAIHEPQFIFFQITLIYGILLRLVDKSKKSKYYIIWSTCLLILTKENYIIFYATVIIGLIITLKKIKPEIKFDKIIIIHSTFAFVLLLLIYSEFFTNISGITELIKSIFKWVNIGVNDISLSEPWYYYLKKITLIEVYILPIILLMLIKLKKISREKQFLLIISILNLIIHSLIPYKTPWLICNIIWPIVILSGEVNKLIILPISLLLLFISIDLNFNKINDFGEGYVHSPTHIDLIEFHNNIKNKPDLKIAIYTKSTWPIAGFLLKHSNSIFFKGNIKRIVRNADIYVVDINDEKYFDRLLKDNYFKRIGYYAYHYNRVVFYYSDKQFTNK